MGANGLRRLGKTTMAAILALSLSVIMTPAVAFANEYDDEFNANYKNTYDYEEGERTDESFDLQVKASAGQTQVGSRDSIDTEIGGALARADGAEASATATVSGNVKADGTGTSAYARKGGSATTMAGDVTVDVDGQFGAYVTGWGESSQATATLGNVTAAAGFRIDSNNNGTATLETGDVKVTKGDGENFNANTISSSRGGTTNAKLGDVTSVASGLVLSARNSTTTVEAGTIDAEESGLVISNDGGGKTTANVKGVTAKSSALSIRSMGTDGQVKVAVEGNAISSEANGLVYMNVGGGTGPDMVLVTETISGATNGVVIYPATTALDLTTWQITAGSGKVIVGDDEDGTFAKSVSYIVKLEQPGEGATLTALKADGSALAKKYDEGGQGGYEVASEGDKVILKADVQSGYEITGAYNGKGEQVALLKDEAGNYYVMVPQGGGVYLSVTLTGGDALTPDGADEAAASTKATNAAGAGSSLPKTGDGLPTLPFAALALLAVATTALAGAKRRGENGR